MLHITYNYALQTIQALSRQGYTASMVPPTTACSASRVCSMSASRGYFPGSTIRTFIGILLIRSFFQRIFLLQYICGQPHGIQPCCYPTCCLSCRIRTQWPDTIFLGLTRPLSSQSAAVLIRSIRFTQVVPPQRCVRVTQEIEQAISKRRKPLQIQIRRKANDRSWNRCF